MRNINKPYKPRETLFYDRMHFAIRVKFELFGCVVRYVSRL